MNRTYNSYEEVYKAMDAEITEHIMKATNGTGVLIFPFYYTEIEGEPKQLPTPQTPGNLPAKI